MQAQSLAPMLGWFSIGLGLAQVLAPRGMSRMIGTAGNGLDRKTMLAVGLRELAAGVGILSRRRPQDWLWARVGGDVMDLAMLANASRSRRARPGRLAMAGAAVLGVLALDYISARRQGSDGRRAG
ncbi:hypothetical protein [Indioceanicola profundi]|uniref:hypothetical protein n=1 Tax=Indioceanicola profundi TaxID=2220096 RepID=UPI000E6AC5F7|nr:hypothetical protein [Indioceanicola profundi]